MHLRRPELRFVSRATVAVAMCIATAAALGYSAPRPGASARDRDLAVRLTRSGPQRLDAPEAIPHSHETTEPDVVFSSLALGLDVGAASGTTAVTLADRPASGPHLGRDPSWVPLTRVDTAPPPSPTLAALPPGRAPPAL